MALTITILLWVLAVAFILAGFVGLVAPALPGPPMVYVGVILIAAAHGFERISLTTLLILGLLTLVIVLIDFAASAVGAKRFGGTKWGAIGAVVGLVVGLFFALPGIIFGPLVGAIAGELLSGRPHGEATRAGLGAFLGLLAGTLVKGVLCTVMVIAALWAHSA